MKHKNIMGLILVFFLLILLSLVFVQSFSFYSIQIKSNFANSIDSMDQRLFPLANNIDEFFLSTTKDLSFLSNLISLQKAIKEDSYIEVEKDLKNFIQDNFEYLDIEYYSSLEELEINVFSESDLQTKNLDYYFKKSKLISQNNLYFEIIQGEETNYLLYVVPIYSALGDYSGMLLVKILPSFFEDIRQYQRNEEITVLIDEFGKYLVNPDTKKENLYFEKDFSGIYNKFYLNKESRKYENGEYFFNYRFVYPYLGSFSLSEGSKEVGINPLEDSWVLVSVVKKEELTSTNKTLQNSLMLYLFLISFLVLFALFGIYSLVWKNK
ncbi:hypothetical protein GW932_03720 [archaeon]|nr:hypothetical protein [archaeon]